MAKLNKSLRKLKRKYPEVFLTIQYPDIESWENQLRKKNQVAQLEKKNFDSKPTSEKWVVVVCPECKTLQEGLIEHNGLWWNSYFCECKNCGYDITESEFDEATEKELACEHEFVAREYAEQSYGTCMTCGLTVFNL